MSSADVDQSQGDQREVSERAAGSSAEFARGTGPIAFYDGECGVCNWAVQFLSRRDAHARLSFAALQGETARALMPAELVRDLDTMALMEGERLSLRSTAVLRAILLTGGFVGLVARLGLLVPRPLRDAAYRLFARNRQRVGVSACRLLSLRERERFLP